MNNYTIKFNKFLSRIWNGKKFMFPASLDYLSK